MWSVYIYRDIHPSQLFAVVVIINQEQPLLCVRVCFVINFNIPTPLSYV